MSDSSRKRIDVLMYHSISEGGGPIRIPPKVFAEQMKALAESDYTVASLRDLAAWRAGGRSPEGKVAIITFDDAYLDFAVHAAPVLLERGWSATVFAPTDWVGKRSEWAASGGDTLMDWKEMRRLSDAGIEFGSHSLSHRNLTTLALDELRRELQESQSRLQQELGKPVRSFAAPYGAANAAVKAGIAEFYDVAAGTRFARAKLDDDVHDVPRVEMLYFTSIQRWRQFLAGKADMYFALRQAGRSVRTALY